MKSKRLRASPRGLLSGSDETALSKGTNTMTRNIFGVLTFIVGAFYFFVGVTANGFVDTTGFSTWSPDQLLVVVSAVVLPIFTGMLLIIIASITIR